jgi:hypothetical protein
MKRWIKCKSYTEARTPIWINLDQVVAITPHINGSTLHCAATDDGSILQFIVWDTPDEILIRGGGYA